MRPCFRAAPGCGPLLLLAVGRFVPKKDLLSEHLACFAVIQCFLPPTLNSDVGADLLASSTIAGD